MSKNKESEGNKWEKFKEDQELDGEEAVETESAEQDMSDCEDDELISLDIESEEDLQQQEIKALKEKILRAHAEMDNIKRRSVKEKADAHKFALSSFIKDLLPILDSLEKALEVQIGKDNKEGTAVHQGVEMTWDLFLQTVEKHGLVRVCPEGEPFNPEFHEAISKQPNPDVEPNTVISVMQTGYTLNGRLIRPAMVVVSS